MVNSKMSGPLEGIRVIDLTTVISGPVCTMLLADQGADVVKIEPPGGDIARRTAGDGEFTAMFVSSNRGKRSLALDLKQPAAREAVRRLIAGADVLVQNFRPGTMARLGLDEPAMRALNPGLIYLSISGVGDTGPYVRKRVYDPVFTWFEKEHPKLAATAQGDGDEDPAVWTKFLQTVPWDKGDAVRGESLFRSRACATCHTGTTRLGPDLTAVTSRFSRPDLFDAILYPKSLNQSLYLNTQVRLGYLNLLTYYTQVRPHYFNLLTIWYGQTIE